MKKQLLTFLSIAMLLLAIITPSFGQSTKFLSVEHTKSRTFNETTNVWSDWGEWVETEFLISMYYSESGELKKIILHMFESDIPFYITRNTGDTGSASTEKGRIVTFDMLDSEGHACDMYIRMMVSDTDKFIVHLKLAIGNENLLFEGSPLE